MSSIGALVPMASVANVARSVDFYRNLGFAVTNTFTPGGEAQPTWVWLQAEDANLMLARASDPVIAEKQAVLFYIYCHDVDAKHAELERSGLDVGPITRPFYAPRGEFRITDPDGYVLMLTHVG